MILVTGATGYIGGRLVPRLLERGYKVAVFVRDPRRIAGRPWENEVDIRVGDLTDRASLAEALKGIDVVYYLIHSMYDGIDFVEQDRKMARNFVEAGQHLQHVIYLGGLLPTAAKISPHLRSRAEVGEILRANLLATEFRAGPIIGSGSASFEMVRYLTQRVPIILAPKWVLNKIQPISIRDTLAYLILACEKQPTGVIDIGSDQLTYQEMMQVYAEERGLMKRTFFIIRPFLPPRLVARWFSLLTPIPNSLAVPLVEGICHSVVGDTCRARALFPEVEPIPYREAVRLALLRIQQREVVTRWSGALGTGPTYELTDREGLNSEVRTLHTDYPPEAVFRSFSSIGGRRGWLVWKWAWEIRGIMDKLVGGPGLRRGRRDPLELLPGEAVDFWRVEEIDPPHRLLLRAEMKVPGQAWMQWEAIPEGSGTRLIQRAMFAPKGLWGVIYWYSLYPIHKFIFSDLVKAVADDARNYLEPKP